MKKNNGKKFSQRTKEFVKSFSNQLPLAFLFHLTVSIILATVRHVWHWLDVYGCAVGCKFFFFFCRPQLCRLARSVSLRTVQLAEQSNRVKEWKSQKVEHHSPDNSHNIVSSKYISYIHIIQCKHKFIRSKSHPSKVNIRTIIVVPLKQCRISC